MALAWALTGRGPTILAPSRVDDFRQVAEELCHVAGELGANTRPMRPLPLGSTELLAAFAFDSSQVLTSSAFADATGTPGGLLLLLPQLKTRGAAGLPAAGAPSTMVIISPVAVD